MSFSIIGTGSALPKQVVTNKDLEELVETSDEWITSRTGIHERRVCTSESVTDLAVSAAQNALLNAGCSSSELDLIICATISADFATPSLACLLQMKLGASCPAFDVNAACTGMIYAMDIADGYFARKPDQKILIVAADGLSRLIDWKDRSTCVLFGDGAAAAVLGRGDGLLAIEIGAEGKQDPLYAPAGWGNSPFHKAMEESPYFKMDGQEVFRFAVSSMVASVKSVLTAANLTVDDMDYLLPHQANSRILDAAKTRLKIGDGKCLSNIALRGNTSAAGVGILLDEMNREGKFQKDDVLVLTAFGGGLTTGACVLRWDQKTK